MAKVNFNEALMGEPPNVFDARHLAVIIGWDLGFATDTLCLLWEECGIAGDTAISLLTALSQVGALKVSNEEAA